MATKKGGSSSGGKKGGVGGSILGFVLFLVAAAIVVAFFNMNGGLNGSADWFKRTSDHVDTRTNQELHEKAPDLMKEGGPKLNH